MDDLFTSGAPLTRSLDQLRLVNRFLGGYSATLSALAPWLRSHAGQKIRLLDLGTGVADFPEAIVQAAMGNTIDLTITAVDANPATVAYARESLARRLPQALAAKITVEHADALSLPYPDQSFDIAIAAMFLHHFAEGQAAAVIGEMSRVSRSGIVVNDLQRHPLAYFGIWALTRVLPAAPMVRHDGPISVLRGFTRAELAELARQAGVECFTIRWHWAFRWVLSSLDERCVTTP